MFRNIFWMGSSTAARLGSSLLLFILIARALGPEEFGHYMFWYTTTLLCSVIANYGLGNMLLKEIAQHPEDAANTLGQALSLRLILSAIILICAAATAWLVDRPGLLFVFLFIHFNDILSETFYAAYRALGHYARETQLATTAAITQLALVALAVYTHQTTEIIALSHLAGRLVQLALILPTARRTVGAFQLHSPVAAFKLAICNKAYFFDGILVNAFGNIDNIVLRLFVGIDTVGIYQSGMRIFQGGLNAIPILSNVFLPIMARQTLHSEKKTKAALALQISFLVFGAIFGFVMAYFSVLIVNLFGENYSSLTALLPFFGLLFFIRFFVAGWGVILIAENQQAYRVISTAIHLLFTLILGSYLTYEFHAKGWLISLILANILLGVLYMVRAIREGYAASARISASAAIAGGLFFIPKLC
jgi:O-antigen/teichoic acid export membrane protein